VGTEVARRFDLEDTTEVSVTFADDNMIKELNNTYRGVDAATDVLSFAFDEDNGGDGEPPAVNNPIHMLGDIIVSLERAQAQGEEYGHSFERELAFLTVHGMLHLLGYDHQEEQDTKEMRSMEEEILSALYYVRDM
jgi:probable rRNA maturation factor